MANNNGFSDNFESKDGTLEPSLRISQVYFQNSVYEKKLPEKVSVTN